MPMTFRKYPLLLQIIALAAFFLAAILPLGYMLAQFVVALFREPSKIMNVLVDSRQLVLLGRSLTVALSATFVAILLGLPTAIILAAKDLPLKRLFYFLVLIPVLIPSYVMAGAWMHLLSPSGLVNQILAFVFGPGGKLTVHSLSGCAWCLGVSFFPIIALIVATGLWQLDSSLWDIARLSTGRWGVLKHAVIPQILPHLAASVCLVMIFVLAQYGVPSLLGVNTYPVEIFAQFSAFYDDAAAIATAVPLVILVLLLVMLQRRFMSGHDYVRITPSSELQNPIALKKYKGWGVVFLAILSLITMFLPFTSVLANAQSLAKIISTIRSFSDGFVTTSMLALLAMIISTAIAFPIGYYLAQHHGRTAKTLDIICWFPIAIPGTIIALGIIKLTNWFPALLKTDSFGIAILVAYVGMFSAFSIRIFQASQRRADPGIFEAAAIDCPRWYHSLLHIDIPIHSGAIVASMVVVFVLTIGELNATVLLIPPGRATLAVNIDNLLHYGANAQASVLCLAEAVLVLLILGGGLLSWHIVSNRQK
jgi:iron(III) transport system permease protein